MHSRNTPLTNKARCVRVGRSATSARRFCLYDAGFFALLDFTTCARKWHSPASAGAAQRALCLSQYAANAKFTEDNLRQTFRTRHLARHSAFKEQVALSLVNSCTYITAFWPHLECEFCCFNSRQFLSIYTYEHSKLMSTLCAHMCTGIWTIHHSFFTFHYCNSKQHHYLLW